MCRRKIGRGKEETSKKQFPHRMLTTKLKGLDRGNQSSFSANQIVSHVFPSITKGKKIVHPLPTWGKSGTLGGWAGVYTTIYFLLLDHYHHHHRSITTYRLAREKGYMHNISLCE